PLLTTGLAGLLFGGYVCGINLDYFVLRYNYGWTPRQIRERGDALVDPDDPDVIYLTVIPRVHWDELLPDKPTDRGFLPVDLRRRRLHFEGLKERYRIPGDAVLACKVEPLKKEAGPVQMYLAVLRVRYPADGPASVSGGHHGDEWLT